MTVRILQPSDYTFHPAVMMTPLAAQHTYLASCVCPMRHDAFSKCGKAVKTPVQNFYVVYMFSKEML